MLIRFECDAVEFLCIKDPIKFARHLLSSTVNCSFHIWEVLLDSCQLRVATQVHIPSNTEGRCPGLLRKDAWGGIQGIQVLKNTIRNYIRTTRMEDGAHSGDG